VWKLAFSCLLLGEQAPSGSGDLGHLSIAERLYAGFVQPGCHPINHSSHVGFGTPPSLSFKLEQPPFFLARASAASERAPRTSMQLGVGSNPDSFTPVSGAQLGSSQHSPLRIKPQRGQVCKDGSESSNSKHWAVLHVDELGLHLANDSGHLSPHAAAFTVEPFAFAGGADVLARKPARNHVNNASPRPSVKGANVIPNWERRECALILSGGKYPSGEGFPLDGTDGPPSKRLAAEYSATSAREKSQLIHGSPTQFHTNFRFRIMLHHEHFHTLFR
jgi:hypothetical protein